MDLIEGVGVEILDQSAGELLPESTSLQAGRILVRVYGHEICSEQIDSQLSQYNTARVVDVTTLSDDWKERWKTFFHRTHIGQRLVVRPPWEEPSPDPDDIDIVIEPGMAFGTGLHETTRLCAQVLEQTLQANQEILDVGCGSGILSIIAVKLGASRVSAIDIDPDSVTATIDNSTRNNVEECITVSTSPLAQLQETFDLVVANILSHILLNLAHDLARTVRANGQLLLSGILVDQATNVANKFGDLGLELQAQVVDGDWVAQVWKRRS